MVNGPGVSWAPSPENRGGGIRGPPPPRPNGQPASCLFFLLNKKTSLIPGRGVHREGKERKERENVQNITALHRRHFLTRRRFEAPLFPPEAIFRRSLSPDTNPPPPGAAAEDLRPPTCDLLYKTFMQHTTSSSSSSSSSGIASWLNHTQNDPPMTGKNKQANQRHEEVLLQDLKLYLASLCSSFLKKQMHTCTARSKIFFFLCLFLIFLPSAQIRHILRPTGTSPQLKVHRRRTEETSVVKGEGPVMKGEGPVVKTNMPSRLQKHRNTLLKKNKIIQPCFTKYNLPSCPICTRPSLRGSLDDVCVCVCVCVCLCVCVCVSLCVCV